MSSQTTRLPIGPPCAIISAGETTVSLGSRYGIGGRNQELALSFAFGIEGMSGIAFASFGTDGKDGNSEASGALVDGETIYRVSKLGEDARRFLEQHDAGTLFATLGDQIITQNTRTNVMDLHVCVIV